MVKIAVEFGWQGACDSCDSINLEVCISHLFAIWPFSWSKRQMCSTEIPCWFGLAHRDGADHTHIVDIWPDCKSCINWILAIFLLCKFSFPTNFATRHKLYYYYKTLRLEAEIFFSVKDSFCIFLLAAVPFIFPQYLTWPCLLLRKDEKNKFQHY